MKLKSVIYIWLLGILLIQISCNLHTASDDKERIVQIIEEVGNDLIPDKRLAVYNIDLVKSRVSDKFIVKGETSVPQAKQLLLKACYESGFNLSDSIQILPETPGTYGLVRLSVANLRSKAAHSAELATQALLGTPLTVLKSTAYWHLVQSPDGYISWVDNGGIYLTDYHGLEEWQRKPKVIFTDMYGTLYNEKGEAVSDLVLGNALALSDESDKYYKVALPDGREGQIPKSAASPYLTWLNNLERTENSLVSLSQKLMGLPYLWGGTSSKGVDCSGFTKTIYFLHGIVLPRDADQQSKVGQLVDETGDFSKLSPGDLLFFGRKVSDTTAERITHVGMWIGDNAFIHAAGRVHISSVDAQSPLYDEDNVKRYIRSTRVLGYEHQDPIIDLKQNLIFQ
ncbi:MAG: C40 family peptidase [Cyclobacteriaceae bacterium]|nr:C40 family peptidase [Cyclobacteriaceae bacterium]